MLWKLHKEWIQNAKLLGKNKGGIAASVLVSLKLRHGKEDPKYYPVSKAGEKGEMGNGEVGRKWLPHSRVLQNFSAAKEGPLHSYHLLEMLASEWRLFFNIKFSNKNCKRAKNQAQDLSFYRFGENFFPFCGIFWESQNKAGNLCLQWWCPHFLLPVMPYILGTTMTTFWTSLYRK